jgi:SAM-dependent methyltransferase
VNLLGGGASPGTADTAEMVAARDAFLARGHYAPVAVAVADAVAEALADTGGWVADVGAGTGYYLARALDRLPECGGLALDISKHATRRAVRSHARIAAAVCDAWERLPLADGSVSALLNVFAPRNPAEFARVLRPGGVLVTVTPRPDHLAELVGKLGLVTVDADKEERLAAALGGLFARGRAEEVGAVLTLGHDDVALLVGMGPSAHHLTSAERESRIGRLTDPTGVTLSVTVTVWRASD